MLPRKPLLIISLAVLAIALGTIYLHPSTETKSMKTIGIVEPLEHASMMEIASGFSDTLNSKPVSIEVKNAQSDPNLERAILQQMRDSGDDIIAPIGVDATQMALSLIHNKPIIGLASDISEAARKKLQNCNLAIVNDEISVQQLITFIHQVYPDMTNILLIHSSANKVLPEVAQTIEAGKKLGITIQAKMITALPELYSVGNSLPENTQGILVLKDHMVVSGISTLAKIAANRKIPLMASDQGSVENGATFALGVHERDIGIEGAKLADKILKGEKPCEIPIVEMTHLTVFVNTSALQSENLDQISIDSAAKQLNYRVENNV